jgi:hypothetical protein
VYIARAGITGLCHRSSWQTWCLSWPIKSQLARGHNVTVTFPVSLIDTLRFRGNKIFLAES